MRKIVLGLVALFTSIVVYSAEPFIDKFPTFRVDGSLKSKVEYATRTDESRFSVRSSRIGVSGYFNQYFTYRGQIEISDNGKFVPLDLFANFLASDKFSISFGQRTIPLFNGYTVVPAELMFSNRPFLGKYLMGTRDIGVLGQYNFAISDLPSSIEAGVYNGNTINSPSWHGKPSYGGRFTLGTMDGWRSTIKFFEHDNSVLDIIRYQVYGADIRYSDDRWRAEAEILKRRDKKQGEGDVYSFYIQGAYIHPMNYGVVKNFIPAVRFDGIEHDDNVAFDATRLTLGLGFGLSPKYLSSIFRIDYEHYFVSNEARIMVHDRSITSNKLTVELLLTF